MELITKIHQSTIIYIQKSIYENIISKGSGKGEIYDPVRGDDIPDLSNRVLQFWHYLRKKPMYVTNIKMPYIKPKTEYRNGKDLEDKLAA